MGFNLTASGHRAKTMTKEEFITERTRIISEMLDNPDKYGIYPTTKCFEQLDELFDKITANSSENPDS